LLAYIFLQHNNGTCDILEESLIHKPRIEKLPKRMLMT
jgi:hypothetical protein